MRNLEHLRESEDLILNNAVKALANDFVHFLACLSLKRSNEISQE